MAESTVWTQLASPNSPAGSVPFVDDDNVSITTDVLNLKYTKAETTTNLTGSFKPKQLTVDGGFRICFDDLTAAAVPTVVTINKPAGKVLIPAGQINLRVNNIYCAPGALVFLQIETNDATLNSVIPLLGNQTFVISGDATATGNTRVAFMIVNTF